MSALLRMDSMLNFSAQTQNKNNNIQRSENIQGGVLTVATSSKPLVPQVQKSSKGDKPQNQANPETKDANGNVKKLMTNRFDRNDCRTCKTRKYMDGSNDPGVSFKSPTNVSAGQSFAAVAGHENEHVTREQSKAKSEGREVVSQNVKLFSAVCPECGVTYTAGGETTTVTKAKSDNNEKALDLLA